MSNYRIKESYTEGVGLVFIPQKLVHDQMYMGDLIWVDLVKITYTDIEAAKKAIDDDAAKDYVKFHEYSPQVKS